MLEINKIDENMRIFERLGYIGYRGFEWASKSRTVDESVVTFTNQSRLHRSLVINYMTNRQQGERQPAQRFCRIT